MKKIRSMMNMKRFVAMMLVFVMMFSLTGEVFAASKTKTVTKSFYPMYSDGGFRFLDVYGKDTIKVTYDTSKKTIKSCSASQSAKNLGTKICEKGGIKVKKIDNKKYQVTSTWYMNFQVMPTKLIPIVKIVSPSSFNYFLNIGRIAKITETYEVTGTGSIKRVKHAYNFMVPSKMQKDAEKILKFFM